VVSRIQRDLHAFAAAARFMARLPAFRGSPVQDMVVHMCDGVWGQVDLRAEVEALHDLGRSLTDLEHIRVPVPDRSAGSDDVLVMEFVGTEDADARRVEPTVAARYILEAVYQMLFRSGLVHVDLHPGNLIVRSSGVTIVDAGFVIRLPDPLRLRFASFFLGLATSDGLRCARAVQESAACVGRDFDQDSFERAVTQLIQRYARMRAREFSLIRFAGELFDLQRRHSLFAESAFVFPLMSLLAVEGQVKRLDPDIDFQAVAIPYVFGAQAG
jgi:ubiquinone biosynthesis protein